MKQRHRNILNIFHEFRIGLVIVVFALAIFQHGSALAKFTYFGTANQYQGRLICQRFGLRLVKDDSQEKHENILQAIAEGSKKLWIDATVTSDINVVKTSDGLELSYKPFVNTDIPTANHCIAIKKPNFKSVPCDSRMIPICENAGSGELFIMERWNITQAIELCKQRGLRLVRITDEEKHLEVLNFSRTLELGYNIWIDAYLNVTSGDLRTHEGTILTYIPDSFEEKIYNKSSCVIINTKVDESENTSTWMTEDCGSAKNVLCEESDDETLNVTTEPPTVINTTESTEVLQRIDDIDLNISQLLGGNFTLNMSIVLAQEILNDIQDVLDDIPVNDIDNIHPEMQKQFTKYPDNG
ncbi:uncharacterized protein [Ptychodera flava]|uniref:uncharacterized protein n=1 Tax=Ptychodera flava TaxID=63121 RepID=UPI00396A6966